MPVTQQVRSGLSFQARCLAIMICPLKVPTLPTLGAQGLHSVAAPSALGLLWEDASCQGRLESVLAWMSRLPSSCFSSCQEEVAWSDGHQPLMGFSSLTSY